MNGINGFFVGEISGLLIRKINVKKSHYSWVSRYAGGFPGPVWTENKNPVPTSWHLLTRSWIPGSLTCHWITRFLVPDAVRKTNRNLVRMEYCQVWLKHLFRNVVVGEPRRVEDWGSKFIKQTDTLFRACLLIINVVSKYMCGIFGLRLDFIISWQGWCWEWIILTHFKLSCGYYLTLIQFSLIFQMLRSTIFKVKYNGRLLTSYVADNNPLGSILISFKEDHNTSWGYYKY